MANNQAVEILALSYNHLSLLPPNFLKHCPKLQKLGLSYNLLSNEIIEQIKEVLLRQGKVIDGKNIILKPQGMNLAPLIVESEPKK